MLKENNAVYEMKAPQKQINIPVDGQLSNKGTVIKRTNAVGEVDYSIADIVEKINRAGFVSKYSCSGLMKDHPFKGVKPDGAYISFLYDENEDDRIRAIENAAETLDLTVERSRFSRRPALVVRVDKDRTGKSLSDRIKMANQMVGMFHISGCNTAYGACTRDLELVLKRNGGLIYDSDEKIEAVWKAFCDLLLRTFHRSGNCRSVS